MPIFEGTITGSGAGSIERCIVVCREERPRIEPGTTRDIEIWPLEHFLASLWRDDLAS